MQDQIKRYTGIVAIAVTISLLITSILVQTGVITPEQAKIGKDIITETETTSKEIISELDCLQNGNC